MSTETSTALAVYDESTALAGLGGSDEIISPSRLRLVQPSGIGEDETLIPGRFLDEQSNIQYPALDVVVLEMRDGRVFLPPGEVQKGAKPICRSNDGIMPVTDDPEIVRQDGGKGCKACPKGQWYKVGGKDIRPECQETRQMLLAEVDTGFAYRYSAKGTAVPPARDLKNTIKKLFKMAQAKKHFLPPYAMKFTLSATKVKGTKGTYFIPKFTPGGEIAVGLRDQMKRLYEYFVIGKGKNKDAAPNPVSEILEAEYVQAEIPQAAA